MDNAKPETTPVEKAAPSSDAGELVSLVEVENAIWKIVRHREDQIKSDVSDIQRTRWAAGRLQAESIIHLIRALPAARAEVSVAEAATIPEDVVELVLRIGRAEWGATAAKSAEEHAADLINSIRLTDEHFKTEGPHRMDGLYIEGTETVICHSGTSPNSPAIAQALTGAWNRLHDEATALRALTEAGE